MMKTAVLCDFDGTISIAQVLDEILIRYADPQCHRIIAQWDSGEIDTPEALERGFSLLRATPAEINPYLDSALIEPAFPAFLRLCREKGYDFHILSDGLTWYIERMLHRYDLGVIPIFANIVSFDGSGAHFSYPWRNEECEPCGGACGTCKRDIVLRFKREGARVIYIGDGSSDRYGAMEADLVFAKRHLQEHLLAVGRPFVPFRDFDDIIGFLREQGP
jgi:2-hydroxy-3-keto-5-methylthiopentenyl-1-phosphate phosphatase